MDSNYGILAAVDNNDGDLLRHNIPGFEPFVLLSDQLILQNQEDTMLILTFMTHPVTKFLQAMQFK